MRISPLFGVSLLVRRPSTKGRPQRLTVDELIAESASWRASVDCAYPNRDVVLGAELAIAMYGASSVPWAIRTLQANCEKKLFEIAAESFTKKAGMHLLLDAIWSEYIHSWEKSVTTVLGKVDLSSCPDIFEPSLLQELRKSKPPDFSRLVEACKKMLGQKLSLECKELGIEVSAVREAWDRESERNLAEDNSVKTLAAQMFEHWKLPRTNRGWKASMRHYEQWIDLGFPLVPNLDNPLDS